jgi:uncharacterized OB-fold protein
MQWCISTGGISVEPIVNRFYGYLKEEKIMGLRCSVCGAVQFPPQGLCPECGRDVSSWVSMSGRGKLLFASVGPHRMMGIEFLQGTVKMEEGPLVSGILLDDGFDLTKPEEIMKYYGRDTEVVAEITINPEGVEAIAFRIENSRVRECKGQREQEP